MKAWKFILFVLIKKINFIIICVCIFVFYCREGISINSKITVCAASSLEPVIFKISDIIKKKLGINLKLNTSSSSIIAKQIEEGIKCDIFASANIDWINYLIKKK